jgi:threonine synthase
MLKNISKSQCLPYYTNVFLKDNKCQPIGNGGQIFTDYRPSQEILSQSMKTYNNNLDVRQHLINTATKQMNTNKCSSINKTKCHYIDILDAPSYCTK